MVLLVLLEKLIPRSFVSLMHRIAYFAARICCFVAWCVCLPTIDVIVARSGRVAPDSHNSDPTMVCIWCVSDLWSDGGFVLRGVLSTG